MNKVFCDDCDHLEQNYRVDAHVQMRFLIKGAIGAILSNSNPPYMCQHLSCFSTGQDITPECIIKWKRRVQRQVQLNKNNDCEYYKKKWYKFWIKEKKL